MTHNILQGVTARDVVISDWRGHGKLTVPKGTKVSNRTAIEPTDGSWFFVDEFGFIDPWLKHDAVHYGIQVKAEDVEINSQK